GRVREMEALEADRSDDLRIAIIEEELRPVSLPLARESPIEILVVGHHGAVKIRRALVRPRARDARPVPATDGRAARLTGRARRTPAHPDAHRRTNEPM